MTIITIPKRNNRAKELVAIPREECEDLLEWKKTARAIREFTPSAAQKRDLAEARKEHKKGSFVTLAELDHELGSAHMRKG